MKKFLVLILIINCILLSACGNDNTTTETAPKGRFIGSYSREIIEKEYPFDSSMFNVNSFDFSPEIAKLSFGLATSAANYVVDNNYYNSGYLIEELLKSMQTSNIYLNSAYRTKPTINTLGVALSTRDFGEYNIVIMAIRGQDYEEEWLSNFDVGQIGDHNGFFASSRIAYRELTDYISNHPFLGYKPLKLLITGYSRGGAVSYLLGRELDEHIKSGEIQIIKKENLFVYSICAPKASAKQNDLKEYGNIHNLYNSHDIVSNYIIPDKYQLNRCGNDYDIYNNNELSIVKEKYGIEIDNFIEKDLNFSGLSVTITDKKNSLTADKWSEKAFNMITFTPENDNAYSLQTRAKYTENLKPILDYIILLYLNNKSKISELFAYFKDNYTLYTIIGVLSDTQDVLYDFMKNGYNFIGIPYKDSELKEITAKIQHLINTYYIEYQTSLLSVVATAAGNIKYFIINHSFEMSSALIDLL